MPRFDVERFRRLLRTRALGQRCLAFEVLASTNTFLYALGRRGEPEGTLVLADEQTAGRGQADKVSISPPRCNLYVSALLRPWMRPAQAPCSRFGRCRTGRYPASGGSVSASSGPTTSSSSSAKWRGS